jgi:PKD repeat protein
MIKYITGLLLISILNSSFSQTVYQDYADGRIYLKLDKTALKSVLKHNPDDLPLTLFTNFDRAILKYDIVKISRPFHQAGDDDKLPLIFKIEFSDIQNVDGLIEDLKDLPHVVYAEKVPLAHTHVNPNDPQFSAMSHLQQINAPAAWNIFNGNSNITVAVVDNAIMWTHADLIGNTYTNTAEASGITGIDDDGNGYIDDINGWDAADGDNDPLPPFNGVFHGTHCAGIAGASTDNGIGVASIGWNIRIIPVKGEPSSSGSTTNVTNGYEGILYAVRAGARVISCSWGGANPSITEQFVIDYAWNRGCIIIASAGNNNNSAPNYPGAYNNVYCVAAVDATDGKSGISSFGPWVDISAPGDNILSTMPYTGTPAYQPQTGTSMATPMVAGLAGLMLSKSPHMTRANVLNCISSTAANIYTVSANAVYTGSLGAGRIDAFAAMSCAATFSAMPPVANFYAFPLNTCPNTAVSFYDSSLYVPTGWSWVFQGGTPGTSTLANPTVSWSTPGTYSVMLTATNANGNSVKSKLSYITVAGPSLLPFAEGFEGSQFLPATWTPNNIWNDNLYWTRVTGVGGFGTSTACAMFDNFNMNVPGERDEMRTPKYDFSNVAAARLRFDVAYARYNASFSDTLEVKVSTNCGATWTSIYIKGGSQLATAPDAGSFYTPASSQWRRDTINISAITAGQGNVMFSFLNRGHYGQPIYLDNINLVFPAPSLSVVSAASVCAGSNLFFNNQSTGAYSYTWNFQGGSIATSTLISPTVTYMSPGTYTALLTALNGPATATLAKTITVVANPTIGITPTATGPVCAGSTVTLTANGANTYTWNVGAQGSTIAVQPSVTTTYSLSATGNGCAGSQSITISVAGTSLALTIQAGPSGTLCLGQTATITANGATNYVWSTGATGNNIVVTPLVNSVYSYTGTTGVCSGNRTISITVAALPISVINAASSECAVCTGSINATTSGGTGPYTYSVSNTTCSALPCSALCQGSYTMQTSDASGCKSENTFTIACVTGIEGSVEFEKSISLFPNPATDAVTIHCKGKFSFEVYNPLGQLVHRESKVAGGTTFRVNELARGIYLVKVDSENGILIRKLLLD